MYNQLSWPGLVDPSKKKKGKKKKVQIYETLSQSILYLEELLECVDDKDEKRRIKKEIKKLRKKQQNYRVPTISEMDNGKTKQKTRISCGQKG